LIPSAAPGAKHILLPNRASERRLKMKLWLIWQNENDSEESFKSAIVAAENKKAAILTHPGDMPTEHFAWDWTSPENVKAKIIGDACKTIKVGVIIASRNR